MVAFLRTITNLFAATSGSLSSSSSSESDPSSQAFPFPATPTPCVRICRYNADFYNGQVCIGCFRETFEIAQWNKASMSNLERSYTLLDAADRHVETFEGSITKEELQRQAMLWQCGNP